MLLMINVNCILYSSCCTFVISFSIYFSYIVEHQSIGSEANVFSSSAATGSPRRWLGNVERKPNRNVSISVGTLLSGIAKFLFKKNFVLEYVSFVYINLKRMTK